MQITYDAEADAMYIEFQDAKPADNVDIEEGVLADLDSEGRIIGLEILDARERIGDAVLADSVPIEQLAPKAALVPSH
jgi:uncharacterized protein YuzE